MHFRGPEGLTIVFGQFEGVDQEKIGAVSRNHCEHAEKRDLKLCAYTRLGEGSEILSCRSEEPHIRCKMTANSKLYVTHHTSRTVEPLLFEL